MTIEFDGLNYETGWRNDPAAVAATIAQDRIVSMSQAAPLKQWDGKTTINLGRYMDKVHGRGTWTLNQGSCGSCVAFGAAISIDTLLAIDHVENGATYPGRTDPMTIYGGSRVQIGGGKVWGQGSVGAWAAKWLKDYGVLLQKKYPGTDLTTYNANVCCSKFGRGGCPPALFPEARLHPIKAYAQAKTKADVANGIANGYPVTVASEQGFTSTRDSRGCAKPSGSWPHQMAIIGIRETDALVINSWGNDWISGPLVDDQPPGSFWADWRTIESMLNAGDSFVLSGINGWESKSLNFLRLNWEHVES